MKTSFRGFEVSTITGTLGEDVFAIRVQRRTTNIKSRSMLMLPRFRVLY